MTRQKHRLTCLAGCVRQVTRQHIGGLAMDYIASDWIENTGTVPAGVGPDTLVEVEYRDGYVTIWETTFTWVLNNDPNAWELRGDSLEVSRFRFLETPAERDARLLRGIGDLLDAGRVVEQTGYEG